MRTIFGTCLACLLLPHALAAAQAREIALDEPARSALPRTQASGSVHGEPLECEGVALAALLRAQGVMPTKPLHGSDLVRVVRVTARDGYAVVFALSELDPSLGARQVVLVDRCNGKRLDDSTGPLRLVVPQDARPARWVRQVQSITIEPSP